MKFGQGAHDGCANENAPHFSAGARLATALPIGDMVHAMNRMNQQQMAWRSDAQQYGAHYGAFNPDARLNPHDVFHTGPGQFQRVGRFDPMKSSVKGGIFGGEQEFNAQPNVQPNIEAIQRVKSRPTGGGDFLDRLALAEQRDEESHRSNRSNISEGNVPAQLYTGGESIHAAGGRIGRDRDFFNDAPRPKTAAERAARVLAAHQQVADQHQQAQQERQMHALRKQAGLNDFKNGRDGRDGSAAAVWRRCASSSSRRPSAASRRSGRRRWSASRRWRRSTSSGR